MYPLHDPAQSCALNLERVPMKKTFAFIALSAALLASCSGPADPANVDTSAACLITDYQNGVLYFDCDKAAFANGLSNYRVANPGMEIISMTGNGNGAYGRDVGYFVVVSPRN